MENNREILVKVNYKNIGELNSFIYDRTNEGKKDEDKYVMCAGKYDKNGWTIVFKAKTMDEANTIVSINSRKRNRVMNTSMVEKDNIKTLAFM